MDQEKLLVMNDVRQLWLFAQRNGRLILTVALAVMVLALVLAWVLPTRYDGTSVIMLTSHKMKFSGVDDVMPSLPPDSSTVRSEIDVLKSRSVIDRVIKDMKLTDEHDFIPAPSWVSTFFATTAKDKQKIEDRTRTQVEEKLSKNLDVSNDGRSFTIAIRYSDHDPVRAAAVANAFADEYLIDQLEVKYDLMQRANAWMSERIESLRNEVATAEKAVEQYKNAHNLQQIKDETMSQQQLSAINVEISDANADYSAAEAQFKSIKGMSASELETSSAVLASPLISQLKQQEAEVRRKEADLAMRYGDRHPAMIDARNELASIREKISEEIHKIVAGLQNDVIVAQAKLDSLKKEESRLRVENGQGNEAMVTLRQLEREAAASRTLYEGFLDKSKTVTEQQDMHMADARIIARAETPIRPVFPNTGIFLALGLALGLVIGFITALLLEYLDRGFRTIDLIEKLYGVSGLGMTPALELPTRQMVIDYVLDKPLSAYAEAIRGIHTSVLFSNVDVKPKVIMVTSSLPDEGKSIFASSFARLLAKSGNKVLLIDADMRRSRVQDIFGLDQNRPDLAAVLAHTATFEQALQKDASGADVLIAHVKTPNPHDLLASKQMEQLIAKVRGLYDMVIIDTPPVMAVSDAVVVGRLADTTVYVVRWAHTPRETVGEGLKIFTKSNLKLAGVVMTQVDMQEQQNYGYSGYYDDRYKGYYAN